MKLFTALAALSIIAAPAAQAGWSAGAPQMAASAYCGARAAGKSQKQASSAAHSVIARSMTGRFSSNIATIVGGMGDMKHAINYQISQMCPEYSGNRRLNNADPAAVDNAGRWGGIKAKADAPGCTDPSVGPATRQLIGC